MTLERRSLGEDAWVLVSRSLEDAGFLGAFTERTGGRSAAPFASLNLSYSSGDAPDVVADNRRRVAEALGTPPWTLGGQVHGAHLVRVGKTRAGSGWDGPDGVIPDTDGLFTATRGIPVAVATADCVPVLLADPTSGVVAAIHAGWRGAAAGILDRALEIFADPSTVLAAIGPAAKACCYEVGPDVALAVAAGTAGGAVTREADGKLFLDLPASLAATLQLAGVEQVEDAGLCTIHEPDRFFSHRRDGAPGGRQFAVAMRR